MWQPVGVVIASAVAYGTAAKYRCGAKLPSCRAVAAGEPCCSVSSNMGWRYEVIVLGGMTLLVFFLRYFVFKFHESPKFLLSRGKEAEAIAVLHKIAEFNKAAPPTLTLADFAEVDRLSGPIAPRTTAQTTKQVFQNFLGSLKHLKGLFGNKLQLFIFVLLAIAYMVSETLTKSLVIYQLFLVFQGDYWSFNLAGSYLPIVLLNHNVSSGTSTVRDTYQQYIIIYTPGIIGAVLALFSVQLPLVGRKWSLVFSAACQGLAMAMYTQVRTTAGYVGLNALEYIMQTVCTLHDQFFCLD